MGYIRLLLAISVFQGHAWAVFPPKVYEFSGGVISVRMFYIISGFLMTMVLSNKYDSPVMFYKSRLLRILPIYYCVVFISILISVVIYANTGDAFLLGYFIGYKEIIGTFGFLILLVPQFSVIGLDFFDAVNHSLTTTSTGGFSTKQASIAAFQNPWVEAVIVIFMLLAGTNFTLIYFGLKMRFNKILKNDEFKWYVTSIFLIVITLTIYHSFSNEITLLKSFREICFQVVSIITTTGYSTADYTIWGSFMSFIFFLFLFSGASAGSTSGGIKIVRIILLIKNGLLEFKRRLHPKAVIPVILNGSSISNQVTYNLLAFIFLYLFVFWAKIIFLRLFLS